MPARREYEGRRGYVKEKSFVIQPAFFILSSGIQSNQWGSSYALWILVLTSTMCHKAPALLLSGGWGKHPAARVP